MRLIELELINFKSFEQEKLIFNDGINCIIGLNGSGKTTIIESIGYALFNFTRRPSDQYVRYGCNKAIIKLMFQAVDDKRYYIIRNISKNNSDVKIIDLSINEVVEEGVSNVYSFIRKLLNIPTTKKLSKVFEEIIAVPQGHFVNAFLDTPANRKETFDKIFDLDIYKDLSKEAKELNDILKNDYIFETDNKISNLEGKLNNYDYKCESLNELNTEILNQINKRDEYSNELKTVTKEITDLENIQKTKVDKENELSKKTQNKNSLLDARNNINDDLLKAKNARIEVDNNAQGYNSYKSSLQTLEQLFAKQQALNDQKSILSDCFNQKSVLEESNANLISNNDTIHKEIASLKQTIIDKETTINELSVNLSKSQEKQKECKKEIKLLSEENSKKKSTIETKLNILKQFEESFFSLKDDVDISVLKENSNKLDIALKEIVTKETLLNELNIKKSIINTNLNNANYNIKLIEDGLCPILKEKCKNSRNASLSDEINNRIDCLQKEIIEVTEEIIKLNSLIINKEELIKEKQIIDLAIIENESSKITKQTLYDDILSKFSNEIDEIGINKENIKDIIVELNKYYTLKSESFSEKEYDDKTHEYDTITSTIASINANQMISSNIIKESQQNIDKFNIQLINNTNKIQSNSNQIKDCEKEIEKYSNVFKEYTIVTEKINSSRKIMEHNENCYNIYLKNIELAKRLDELSIKLENNNKELDEIDINIDKINSDIKELNKVYNQEKHTLLLAKKEDLNKSVISLNASLAEKEKIYNEQKKELDILNEYKLDLTKALKQKEIYLKVSNKLNIAREVYNSIPKYIGQRYREYIQIEASIYYQKISNEFVRLEISNDYEVSIIECLDNNKTRKMEQLSGGEQMSVAIAIRLAMLKKITGIDFYFMDEPTINLDAKRRYMLSEIVNDISSELSQLFVISHDDTFESVTDNIIKLNKNNNISVIEK